MIDPVKELKLRAERLHHALSSGAVEPRLRLRALPEFRARQPQDLAPIAAEIQRKHCLAVVARETGFNSWAHALAILTASERAERGENNDAEPTDFGTILCPPGLSAHWNIWSASYGEAKAIRGDHGGYLLAYKRHYFIVDRYYVESLGLDPDDADWERIGRDWVRPIDPSARGRLYGKLLARAA